MPGPDSDAPWVGGLHGGGGVGPVGEAGIVVVRAAALQNERWRRRGGLGSSANSIVLTPERLVAQ